MRKKIIILLTSFILITISMLLTLTEFIDHGIYHIFSTKEMIRITSIAKFITEFGSAKYIIIITLILIFILNTNYKRLFLLINTISSTIIIGITKIIFLRPRPLIGQQLLSSYSYPSGHSLIATTYYGFLIFLIRKSNIKNITKNILTIIMSSLIIMIGTSRIILNVHYLTDVIAGFILGMIILLVLIYLYEKNINKKVKEKPLTKTIMHGIDGIIHTIKKERNMLIHFLIMILVITAGVVFKISFIEWLICFILFGIVLSLELMNTAVENVVDLVTEEKKEKAKRAKDTAAGAVLIAAIISAIIGILIFLPKLLML